MVKIAVNGAWSPGFLLSGWSQGSVDERNKEGNINVGLHTDRENKLSLPGDKGWGRDKLGYWD